MQIAFSNTVNRFGRVYFNLQIVNDSAYLYNELLLLFLLMSIAGGCMGIKHLTSLAPNNTYAFKSLVNSMVLYCIIYVLSISSKYKSMQIHKQMNNHVRVTYVTADIGISN